MAVIFCALILIGISQFSQAAPPQKIVGGSDAAITDYPWVVSLRYYGSHMCGGVFISRRHILTAAHCVRHDNHETKSHILVKAQDLSVAAGSSNCVQAHNVYRVKNFVIYPDYNGSPPDYLHDIAIITLTRPIVEDDTQRVIDLPTENISDHKFGYVVGWGKIAEDNKQLPELLKKTPMWTISNAECYGILPHPIYGPQLCARYSIGRGFCDGDSGGPLIVGGQVVGVVSMSYGCGTGLPDIYTRVYSYLSWIHEKIK